MFLVPVRQSVWVCGLVVAISCLAPSASAENFSFFHEHVLGTSLEIQLEASDSQSAEVAEQRILAEIERLAKIFSSYQSDSEFSRWQNSFETPVPVSPELREVLAASAAWQEESHGALNPAVEKLSQLWKQGEARQAVPTAAELSQAVAAIQTPQWHLDPIAGTATRLARGPLSLNALAKGDILDRACSVARKTAGVQGALVCLGGDMRVSGDLARPVHVVDPANDAVNAAPVATIHVHERGLATSGGYRRGVSIQGQWYSHILDPRSGRSVDHVASATVVAATARDADALATIFSVLSPAETVQFAAARPDVEYLLITPDGKKISSPGWSDLEQPGLFRLTAAARTQLAQADAADSSKPESKADETQLLELMVNFELARPEGSQYRRPYVAIWLEDADEFPVKTALLWMQTKQPGPRWHRDLLRWYRNDAVRKLADKRDLIGTVSGATRGPGKYKAVFDGKDDAGNALPPGKYTLFIEVAREHGTYQLIRQPLTLGAEPIAETKLKNNVEVESASFEYRHPASTKPDGK
jgi:thiamine biosynthesis lipoprotein ApbE